MNFCINIVLLFCLQFSYMAQSNFDKGVKEYYYGDLNLADSLLTISINESDDSLSLAYMYRGAAKGFLGDFNSAIRDLNSSKNIDSTNYLLYYYYGKVYFLQENFHKAIRYFNKSISIESSDANIFDNKAFCLMKLGDYSEAIRTSDQAISIEKNDPLFYINRAVAKHEIGLYEDAILDFTLSLKIQISYKALINRGVSYSKMGQNKLALKDYESAIGIYPNEPEAYYQKALIYLKLSDYDKACDMHLYYKKLGGLSLIYDLKNCK